VTHTPASLAQLEIYRQQASSLLRARAYPKARQLYEKLLENGIVAAATRLGYIYSQTDNPEYDRDKAISHYEISAKNHDTYAQYALGCLLLQAGRRDEALKWFCEGSDLGDDDVCSYFAFSAVRGTLPSVRELNISTRGEADAANNPRGVH
jgi:TPR repeat protein